MYTFNLCTFYSRDLAVSHEFLALKIAIYPHQNEIEVFILSPHHVREWHRIFSLGFGCITYIHKHTFLNTKTYISIFLLGCVKCFLQIHAQVDIVRTIIDIYIYKTAVLICGRLIVAEPQLTILHVFFGYITNRILFIFFSKGSVHIELFLKAINILELTTFYFLF